MQIKEWLEQIDNMPFNEAVRAYDAINYLMHWQTFKKAFNGFGLEEIRTMLKTRIYRIEFEREQNH